MIWICFAVDVAAWSFSFLCSCCLFGHERRRSDATAKKGGVVVAAVVVFVFVSVVSWS